MRGDAWDLGGRRRVAAAAAAHQTVNHDHADARNVATLHAVEQVAPGGVLGPVHEDKVGIAADFDQAAIEPAQTRRVAGGKTKCQLGRNVAQAGEQRHHAQHAQRLHTRAGRAVSAQNHAVRAFKLQRSLGRGDRHFLVAVVHDLNSASGLLAQLANMLL